MNRSNTGDSPEMSPNPRAVPSHSFIHSQMSITSYGEIVLLIQKKGVHLEMCFRETCVTWGGECVCVGETIINKIYF